MAPHWTLPSALQLASHRSSNKSLPVRPPPSTWELMVAMSLHPSCTASLLSIGHHTPVPHPVMPYPLSPTSGVDEVLLYDLFALPA